MSDDKKIQILVVDDVPDRLVAMRAALEDLGADVVTVGSGRDALRQLLHDDFAVILLDVNMPDMDGFETAALIRQRLRSEHTPIIFVTAFGDETHAGRGYSLGAVDYLLTPVVPEVLRAKVRVFVELFQKNEQLKRQAERQAALAALADRRATQLRALAAELAQAEQRERRRLAQALHDHIQQLLVAARMRVDRVRDAATEQALARELGEVDDLLEQSIAASRSLAVELCPPVLNEAGLAAAFEWLARWMQEKYGLTVDVECPTDLQPITDEMRLTLFQAVRELLFNVVKHSGVERARLGMERAAGRGLCITIEDAGAGFDPELVQERTGTQGGLGLFSVRERLEVLGGGFEIDSAPGRGTLIRLFAPVQSGPVRLPATRANGSSTAALVRETPPPAVVHRLAPRAAEPARVMSGKIRVLLADDHAVLRQGLKLMLRGHPEVEVVGEAGDGHEAVALAASLKPDVVVMDINMPRLNGIEAARRIRQDDTAIQIIGLSLHEDPEITASFLEAGAAIYLAKDGPSDQLFNTIRTLCCR